MPGRLARAGEKLCNSVRNKSSAFVADTQIPLALVLLGIGSAEQSSREAIMAMAATRATSGDATSTRWIQLVLGLIAMMAISSPQYVWTLFTKPFQGALSTTLPALQVTVTILIVL